MAGDARTVELNGRSYQWPEQPVVVVCIDGSEPGYVEAAVETGKAPFFERILAEGTWISGLDKVFLQLRRQLLLNPVKLTISSQVHQLARILFKGIEFLGGTLGKRQVVEPPKTTLVLILQQQLFGR